MVLHISGYIRTPATAVLEGKLFVDGSLLSKHGAQGGQAGWAVVQVDEASHELVCAAHGAMPVTLPVQRRIMRAELWALLQALSLSEPGASFISDCATVLRGIERGEKWCTVGRRPHADVWREIWRLFRGVGKGGASGLCGEVQSSPDQSGAGQVE